MNSSLSRRPKFYFATNHPTALTQKTGRENQLHSPLSGFSPTAQFQAKPHLVGNSASLYPTYCGDKKNLKKSYWNDIPKQNPVNLAPALRKRQLIRRGEQKIQRDFFPRDGGNFPECFRCVLNFRSQCHVMFYPELRSWGARPPRALLAAPRGQPLAREADTNAGIVSVRPGRARSLFYFGFRAYGSVTMSW
jgi:hypothetical protein